MKYVLGLAFSPDNQRVVLIRKSKPAFQVGKLNGVGGKIEDGETPIDAMVREFKEECGLATMPTDWHNFCTLSWDDGVMHCFMANIYINKACTQEEEVIEIHYIDKLHIFNHMPNLLWLIAMAQSMKNDSCKKFEVVECPAT